MSNTNQKIHKTYFKPSTASTDAKDLSENVNGVNGWYMPSDDGTLQWIDENEAEAMLQPLTEQKNLTAIAKLVKYYLLSKVSTTQQTEETESTDPVESSSTSTIG